MACLMLDNCMYEQINSSLNKIRNLEKNLKIIPFNEFDLNFKNKSHEKLNYESCQPFYPLSSSSWDVEEEEEIIKLVRTQKLTMGENVKKFETLFSNYTGAKYSLMTNSGSSANLLIIAGLVLSKKFGINKGDEIIVPAIGWSTSFSPLSQYGLKLRFVDVNLETLNIDENEVINAITSKTKAILAINILGNPAELVKLRKISKKYGLTLIEDNCECLGSKLKNKHSGTFGIASSHSFHFSHHIQTIEGGMVCTDDEDLYHFLLSLRSHGWTRDLPFKCSLHQKTGIEFNDAFKFITPGYNFKPNEINAVVGLKQLEKYPFFLNQRKKNAFYFSYLFRDLDFCLPQKIIGSSSWFGFSLILKNKLENKRSLVLYELCKAGIETRPIVTGNFLKNPVIEYFDYSISKKLLNAEIIDLNGLFFGNDHRDLRSQILKVREVFDSLLKKI